MNGTIFDIKKYAIHDGPGIRTTVFFKGCPLHCDWCHNPEGVSADLQTVYRQDRCIGCLECVDVCPQGAVTPTADGVVTDPEKCVLCGRCAATCPAEAREMIGRTVTAAEVIEEVEKDRPFFDQSGGGVTFSGGEPLMQPAFLLDLLARCQALDFHCTVDTTGYTEDRSLLLKVAEKADLFLYDLKHMDSDTHRRRTGVSNDIIKENLARLAETGARIIIRIPIIGGFSDDEGNANRTAAFLAELPGIRQINILPYHDGAKSKYKKLCLAYPHETLRPLSKADIDRMAEHFRKYGFQVRTGG
jgi:pyruvate formate lyase activating enzyme